MVKETTISKNLQAAEGRAEYDAACKYLLAEKRILAWIMKSCLPEYLELDIDEIATKYITGGPEVAQVPVLPEKTNMAPFVHGSANKDAAMARVCLKTKYCTNM